MKISIAMATRNGGRYLAPQLQSFAEQTILPHELCVGDDLSTDDTAKVVAEFAKRAPFPVRFHRNPTTLGYGQNFIETARRCSGDWIAFSDQDDAWLPAKIETCLAALTSHDDPELLMIAHSAAIVNEDLAPTGRRLPEDFRNGVYGPLSHELTWSHYGFAMLFRADLISCFGEGPRIPTIYTNIDRYPHDVWISSLANILGKTIHMTEELCLYRRHGDTVTRTAKAPRPSSPFASLRQTGAAFYRHKADICREAADCLRHHAQDRKAEPWRKRLMAGEAAYRELALVLEQRATIYEAPALTERLMAVGRLTTGKGYFGMGASSLGIRSMAKDLAASLSPALFR
jgi:rhamnosyltransferase